MSEDKLDRVLKYLLDEREFLSPYGIRSLSKFHENNPVELNVGGQVFDVSYVPGESSDKRFGGNVNWRGPVWICGKCYMVVFGGNVLSKSITDSIIKLG